MENTRFGLRKRVSVIFEGMGIAPAAGPSGDLAADCCSPVQKLRSQIEYVMDCLMSTGDPHPRGRV